jgi:acyl dehydratase
MIQGKTIDDFQVGDAFLLEVAIREEMVDEFARLSGDFSTIHMDSNFAKSRGFNGRVVHGVLLTSFLSRIVGMHFPGENALLQTIDSRFSAPAYIGDTLRFEVVVDQVSTAAKVMVLKATAANSDTEQLLMRSKIQVGFTER